MRCFKKQNKFKLQKSNFSYLTLITSLREKMKHSKIDALVLTNSDAHKVNIYFSILIFIKFKRTNTYLKKTKLLKVCLAFREAMQQL